MIIKDTSACSLESNPEWVCAWLTSWLTFGCVPRGHDTASDGPLLHVILLSRDILPWLRETCMIHCSFGSLPGPEKVPLLVRIA